MRKSSWLPLCAALLALCAVPFPVLADDAPNTGAAANMPQRERDLIDILMDARKQYRASKSANPAETRVNMQIRVIGYMRQSQVPTDWIGTVKSRGLTPNGNAWITIEIADGITVGTWTTERDDGDSATLIRPHAKLFAPAQAAKLGAPIIFSGTIVKSELAGDEEMIQHPSFIARFSELRPAQ